MMDDQAILLKSAYLDSSYPLDLAKYLFLYVIPGGLGQLLLSRGVCNLNPFGDIFRCTDWGTIVREVTLSKVAAVDPHGEGRFLYEVRGAGFDGKLSLITPSNPISGSYRLLFEGRGVQKVIPCQLQTPHSAADHGPGGIPIIELTGGSGGSHLLDFEKTEVVGPFDDGICTLLVSGTISNLSMDARLMPLLYVKYPTYCGIQVVAFPQEPAIHAGKGPYLAKMQLKHSTGMLGVEVIGNSRSERLTFREQKED